MLASYGPIARRSAAVAAGAAVIMIVLGGLLGGAKGLLGSVLGAALVAVFFAISIAAVSRAEKVSPRAQMVTALTTFIVKILVLMVLVSRFSNTPVRLPLASVRNCSSLATSAFMAKLYPIQNLSQPVPNSSPPPILLQNPRSL